MSPWPLTTVLTRLLWLRALCGIAEGATAYLVTSATLVDDASVSCVAAVLGDAQKRLCILGGRELMPRSLGSILGSLVARFLGGLCGKQSRRLKTRGIFPWCSGVAISHDGSTLLMSGSHAIHVFSVCSGELIRTVGGFGNGPLQFMYPRQVCIALDDFVFVVDSSNNRIQILTPRYDFHSFVGVGQLHHPFGVFADAQIVAVSQYHSISVFGRSDGALHRRFGSSGSGPAQGSFYGLSSMGIGRSRRLAAVDWVKNCVSVFSLNGEFVRNVGVGKLRNPCGIASSNSGDELVVADNKRVVVLSASGEILLEIDACSTSRFVAVTVHNNTVFAQTESNECVVLT